MHTHILAVQSAEASARDIRQLHRITTERLTLRQVEREELIALWAADGRQTSTGAAGGAIPPLAAWAADLAPGCAWSLALRDQPNQLLGFCGFATQDKVDSSAELLFGLGCQYWGKGYTAEALSALLTYCFCFHYPFPLSRVTARAAVQDYAAFKLLRKLGFHQQAVTQLTDEAAQDEPALLFGLSRQEWQQYQQLEP